MSDAMSDSTSNAFTAAPGQWTSAITLQDGTSILVRPIQPHDDALMASFIGKVSAESARNRFHFRRSEFSALDIHNFTHVDYEREMAFVAIVAGRDRLIGVSRYSVDQDRVGAEFALLIADEWQRLGVGRTLLATLAAYATSAGLKSLHGITHSTNDAMLSLARSEGFSASNVAGEPSVSELRKCLRA